MVEDSLGAAREITLHNKIKILYNVHFVFWYELYSELLFSLYVTYEVMY